MQTNCKKENTERPPIKIKLDKGLRLATDSDTKAIEVLVKLNKNDKAYLVNI